MNKFIKIHSKRHFIRILCALVMACILNYFISHTKQGWLPLATVIVMLTATGSALYQGLLRFFLVASVVLIGSLFFSSSHSIFIRLYDIVLGALLGIITNIVILPDQVDSECRSAFIPILKSYSHYFSTLMTLLLDRDFSNPQKIKIEVEKNFQKMPAWIYETGFDVTLQKGYHYFFMKVGQMGDILFSMHHIARFPFSEEIVQVIRPPLLRCVSRFEQCIIALVMVLELKKLKEGVIDFDDELVEMEKKLKLIIPSDLGKEGVPREYIYLTEFIYDLRDLRGTLLNMVEAVASQRNRLGPPL